MERRRPRVLFVCGSRNQTTQLHQVAREMPEFEHGFTPYFATGVLELLREWGLLDFTIAGGHWRTACLEYLREHRLPIDVRGEGYEYDLVVTCQDIVVPHTLRAKRAVLVQEGMVDPPNLAFHLARRFGWFPRWLASTSTTGLSHWYERFCVASEGFRELFARRGVRPESMVVTGIPNFSRCEEYLDNAFPHRGFALVCTSDARETFKFHDRRRVLRRAKELARGRPIIVKLHPNERFDRATQEVAQELPGALVFTSGKAEEMIANCEVLVTEWSSTALVGLALGKEVHSLFDIDELRTLVPLQTRSAAANIADVCREVLYGFEPVRCPRSASPRISERAGQPFAANGVTI